MQLARFEIYSSQQLSDLEENILNLGLVNYASDAAYEMGFESINELYVAVRRAMDIFIAANLPIRGNFLRICKSSRVGLIFDWKLSPLAFQLVCICGEPDNPNVGKKTVELLLLRNKPK